MPSGGAASACNSGILPANISPDLDLQQHVGRVMPAFLPTATTLVDRLGGGDPLAVAESRLLFRRLMIWGLSMILVGALLCQVFAGALARASIAP
jgi:hypothetical protein